jgi:hypothetical protein
VTEPSLSEWLSLRQHADFAARSARLTTLVAERLASIRPLRILDLGTGTGSNIRFLAPRIGGEPHWLAVDQDQRLLDEAAAATEHVDTHAMDLGAMDAPGIFEKRHLVTGSALLDLVSEQWLGWLAAQCARVGAAALFTINYNGRNHCTPGDPLDDDVFALFNRHQATDKGLGGPAAGPRATDVAMQCFMDAGYEVFREPSDWHLASDQRALQIPLIDGWASAAIEMAPERADEIAHWRQRHTEAARLGRLAIDVGHWDLLAMPVLK